MNFETEDSFVIEAPNDHPRREAVAVAHETFGSFYQAVCAPQLQCNFCPGFADALDHVRGCPRYEPVAAADANAGIRKAFHGGRR